MWYRNLERVEYDINWVFLSRVILDGIRIPLPCLVQVPFMGEPGHLDYVYHVSNLFVHCICLLIGLITQKNMQKKFFLLILNRFLVTLYVPVLIVLVRVCQTLT